MPDQIVPRIYLAGPMVFEPDPAATFVRMKAICAELGVTGVAPIDNQAGLEGVAAGKSLVERIVRADIALMRELDGGVFCLDGFRRGPEMDAGTAFEVGYMAALGKPMAGWTRDGRSYPDKVRDYFRDVFAAELVATEPNGLGGTSGLTRDPDGVLVHSEGCVQNAMVHVGIEITGGLVAVETNWEAAFRQAVMSVRRQVVAL